MSDRNEELVKRALGYPYTKPSVSFFFDGATTHILGNEGLYTVRIDGTHTDPKTGKTIDTYTVSIEVDGEIITLENRIPVLAIGSNAAPKQLARKFKDFKHDKRIPVIKTRMDGYRVVPSASVTSYGSIPATFEESEGHSADIFTTFLSPEQFTRMNTTESLGKNYTVEMIEEGKTTLANGTTMQTSLAYRSLAGSFRPDGESIPLTQENQERLQEILLALLNKRQEHPIEKLFLILSNINDSSFRQRSRAVLKEHAHPYRPDPDRIFCGLPEKKAKKDPAPDTPKP